MRWEAFGARLNTHRGFGPNVWVLLPFGGICMQYDDYRDTDIEIQMIHMWFRPLGPVWVHTEALGHVLGCLVFWGPDYTCTDMMRYMRYEMTFPRLSIVTPRHDGSLIARLSRSGYDEIIFLGTCLVIVINIQYLILQVLWFHWFYADLYNIVVPVPDLN